MRVVVVSDTHLPRFGRRLPGALVTALTDPPADLVLHLGDHTAAWVPELFSEFAAYEGVAGNNDGPELHSLLGRRRIVSAAGVRIGMVHGHEGRGRTTPERAWRAFESEAVDVVAFGHSHVPLLQQRDSRWLVNPGSPTDRRRQPRYSYAVLDVRHGEVAARLCFYADRTPATGEAAPSRRA